MNLLECGIWMLIACISCAYYSDEQATVIAEIHKKFLLRVPEGLRRFLIFSKRSSRRYFFKSSVYMEIFGYIVCITDIVLFFIVKDASLSAFFVTASYSSVFLFGMCVPVSCMVYCNYKSRQFKKQKKKHRKSL